MKSKDYLFMIRYLLSFVGVPKYQQTMLPLLELISDGKEHIDEEIHESLATHFKLNEEKLLGSKSLFQMRWGWGRFYLKEAGLLEHQNHQTQITQLGEDLLRQNPKEINHEFLMKIPKFAEFIKKTVSKKNQDNKEKRIKNKNPEDKITDGIFEVRKNLEGKILDKLRKVSPYHFEQGVKDLLGKMNYKLGEVVCWGGEGGISGTISDDELGPNSIYLQAKRWEGIVPEEEIKEFVNSVMAKKLKKAIFITTSDFSKDEKEFVNKIDSKITLLNGEDLASFMYDYDIGLETTDTYELKKLDNIYFTN